MDKQDHFISAFPNDGSHANNHHEGGMTLRDYFAAVALPAVMAVFRQPEAVAAEAYRYADAMIAERKR